MCSYLGAAQQAHTGQAPALSGVVWQRWIWEDTSLISVITCGECWGLALNHRWLWWHTQEEEVLPVLWEVLQYTTGWVKRNHWEQREVSISDDVPWNHPWIKFTSRNLLKGKTTIVKTTPYQCNTTSMYQGWGLLSPHDNLRPEFRNPGFIPNGLKALKREQTPWRNAHSCAQIIRIWCPVFTNLWSLVNGPLLRHILLMCPQHSSVTNTKRGQLAGMLLLPPTS